MEMMEVCVERDDGDFARVCSCPNPRELQTFWVGGGRVGGGPELHVLVKKLGLMCMISASRYVGLQLNISNGVLMFSIRKV